MDRNFLDLAREVIAGGQEVHRRGAIVHAYFAFMLESREAIHKADDALVLLDSIDNDPGRRATASASIRP